MQRLEVINQAIDHIVLSTDEPARFEVSLIEGRILIHGYDGIETDLEQEPTVVYDGTVQSIPTGGT